jgi:hypothetical protein
MTILRAWGPGLPAFPEGGDSEAEVGEIARQLSAFVEVRDSYERRAGQRQRIAGTGRT